MASGAGASIVIANTINYDDEEVNVSGGPGMETFYTVPTDRMAWVSLNINARSDTLNPAGEVRVNSFVVLSVSGGGEDDVYLSTGVSNLVPLAAGSRIRLRNNDGNASSSMEFTINGSIVEFET